MYSTARPHIVSETPSGVAYPGAQVTPNGVVAWVSDTRCTPTAMPVGPGLAHGFLLGRASGNGESELAAGSGDQVAQGIDEIVAAVPVVIDVRLQEIFRT